MRGHHVLITGASAGLGAALAVAAARKGANLTLAARRLDRLAELEQSLRSLCPEIKILAIKADVSDKKSVAELIANSVAHFGRLDCLIANAGQGMWTRFSDLADPDQLKDLMQLNYMGVVYSAFYALPHLRKAQGSLVAISSVQGVIPVPYHTGYVASKYAVNGFIDTLRMEEPEVNFLLALPGWIGGTELRAQALTSSGEGAIVVKSRHNRKVVSADQCAEQIIAATIKKQSQLFIPRAYACVPLLRCLLRTTVDKIIKTKVDQQLKTLK